jgi:hypothetical protein
MRAPLLVLAGFTIIAALIAWSRWLSKRRWAAAGNLLLAVMAALVALLGWPVVRDLESYETAVRGQAIASVFVEKTGSRSQRVTLTRLPSGRMQVFELDGDEWRLLARELDWTSSATSLGFRRRYRLESLDSRDSSASGPSVATEVALAEDRGFDLWARARPGSIWSRFAVPRTRSMRWESLIDKARFRVYLADDGLMVERPDAPPLEPEDASR